MKNLYMLMPVLLVLFTSLCVDLPFDMPDIPLPNVQQNVLLGEDTNLQISIETVPSEVVPGRNLTLIFQAVNRNTFDIDGIVIEAYDDCIFDSSSGNIETIDLRSNQSKTWTWEWVTGPTSLEKNCEIKFKVEYQSTFYRYQDIVVLSSDEYLSRQISGTLNNIPVKSTSSKAPIDVTITFPEKQPFQERTTDYSMYIDYYIVGDGFITVQKGGVNIDSPNSINLVQRGTGNDCGNYFEDSDSLRFINKKASRTTCYFDTTDIIEPIDIQTMILSVDYTHLIDKSIFVKVNPGNRDVELTSPTAPAPESPSSSSPSTPSTPEPETQTCEDAGGHCFYTSICSSEGGHCIQQYECSDCCCVGL